MEARDSAVQEMKRSAYQLEADTTIGVDVDYEVLGAYNGVLMITASGVAVRPD